MNEAESDIEEEHMVHGVTRVDSDPLSLERVANGNQRGFPPNAPACGYLARQKVVQMPPVRAVARTLRAGCERIRSLVPTS